MFPEGLVYWRVTAEAGTIQYAKGCRANITASELRNTVVDNNYDGTASSLRA